MNRIIAFQFLFLFNLLFSQVMDLGPVIDKYPDLHVRDSLSFFIHEGESPLMVFSMEGGALEIESESVIRVEFSFINQLGQFKKYPGKLFRDEFSESTFATFIPELNEEFNQFSFTIITTESIGVKSVIGFISDPEIIPGAPRTMTPAVGDVPKPTIVTREEWGAEPPKYSYSNHPYIDKLTLHHAACCSAEDLEEGKSQVRWIQDFHQNGRGWNDIAYHFLIDRAGNIYQGRPETVVGSHVGGANTGNIGVCLLGCYHPPEENCFQTMTEKSGESIIHLFGWISDAYGQNPASLLGHRDYFGNTACPGDNVWYELPGMRIDIIDYMESLELPLITFLQPAFPNPFSNQVTFSLEMKDVANISIDIYDLLGRKVKSIGDNNFGPGKMNLSWDGKNDLGEKLSNGMYFAQPDKNSSLEMVKLVMMKN